MKTVSELEAEMAAKEVAHRVREEAMIAADIAKLETIEAAGILLYPLHPFLKNLGSPKSYETQRQKIREVIRGGGKNNILSPTSRSFQGRFLGIACDSCRTELYKVGRTGFTGEVTIAGCPGCGRDYHLDGMY